MRTDKRGEEAREATPTLQVFAPGEAVPSPHVPAAAPRKFERGNGPLDTPKPRPRRQVGRRIFEYGK
jgi:hypothetical protein